MEIANVSKLKEAIQAAEDKLDRIDKNIINLHPYKQKKIKKELEKAYKTLNNNVYTQKELDKCEEKIWRALNDDSNVYILLFFIMGFLLSGVTVYSVYETFSFIQTNWNSTTEYTEIDKPTSELVIVTYDETNIFNILNVATSSDAAGIKSKPLTFEISNDGTKVGTVTYKVNYSVSLEELTTSVKSLDKKYLKYQYIITDENGKKTESNIGTFDELEKNADGTYLLNNNVQNKNGKHKYELRIWISNSAGNDQQELSYAFIIRVNALIAKV